MLYVHSTFSTIELLCFIKTIQIFHHRARLESRFPIFTANTLQSCRKSGIHGNTIRLNVKNGGWHKCDSLRWNVMLKQLVWGKKSEQDTVYSHTARSIWQLHEAFIWGTVRCLLCRWFDILSGSCQETQGWYLHPFNYNKGVTQEDRVDLFM